MDTIPIKGYKTEYDQDLHKVRYYAILEKGKTIEMPAAFAKMYDNEHLAIAYVEHIDMPELLDVELPYYQPMRTVYNA